MTWHPKPSLTVETLHWTSSNVDSVSLLSSSRLWDPDFQRNAKFTFIREHNFGPLSSSPVLFVFSQARRFWRCLLFSGLTQGMRQLKPMSCIRLCVVVLEALTPAAVHLCESPHIFEWVLFHNPLQGAVIPIACTLFSTTSFPSLRLSINVLGHRALWTASLFCNDLLCLALLVQGVNVFPWCVAYRTRLRDHLKVFACVELISWLECGTRCLQYWTFSQYSNFLRYWIWGFH